MRQSHSAQSMGGGGNYTVEQLNSSALGKDAFFARKMHENAMKSDALPPSRGGKYVGFGSAPSAPSGGGGSGGGGGGNGQVRVAERAGALLADALLPGAQLLDDTWSTVSQGLSRLTVAASNAASATVATVKPGLHEVSQRYQRGELAESAATLVATGADLGLKGLSNLKGLLKTAVSQIDGYAGASALQPRQEQEWRQHSERQPAERQQSGGYQQQGSQPQQSGGWNGWEGEGEAQPAPAGTTRKGASKPSSGQWAGWDSGDGAIPDEVWEADWGK